MRHVRPAEDRFFEKVAFGEQWYGGTPCLVWRSPKNDSGYGVFGLGPRAAHRKVRAHRWLYERWVGPIPDGLQLDHLCRNRACVNPAHLEPVTQAENIRRGKAADATRQLAASITHCPKGHPYSGDNLYIQAGGRSGGPCRQCRICVADRQRAYQARKKAAASAVASDDGSGPFRSAPAASRLPDPSSLGAADDHGPGPGSTPHGSGPRVSGGRPTVEHGGQRPRTQHGEGGERG